MELCKYDQFLTYFWNLIFVYKNNTYIQKIMKIAPKLSVLLAKNHWRLTLCLPLYIQLWPKRLTHYGFGSISVIWVYTVEDKMLGANGFWLIKHSIWEQFS